MSRSARVACVFAAAALMLPVVALPQGTIQSLIVKGAAGSIPVTQMNGRNYVEVEALARAANAAVSYQGNQITLALPGTGGVVASTAAGAAASTALSPDFLRAGIEAMSTIREWHSVLASLIENGYPVTGDGLAPYQGQATRSLRLAQVAATSNADQEAMQSATNAFEKMKRLNDKYVSDRSKMKYIDPDALKNDPLDQSLVACGRALGAMIASGQFTDDPSCH
ncbi:MAG TPA: hypothetical protein VLW84_01175 [Terriglobales bacterium]|nr:hypothetical protein [Terriglobales bacterium]